MTDKELLDKAINWFKVIAEDMERITSGNLSHNAATTKGRAIRAYEFLEKHRQEEPVSEDRKEAILKKAHELAKEVDLIKDYFPKTAIIAVACDMAEWCDAHPIKKPVSEDLEDPARLWHDASERPSIFGTYLLIHEGGWCVARYYGKEVPTGNTTGWVEISQNIFVEHPQKWLDLSDLLPKAK